MSENMDRALDYAARLGWAVFPVHHVRNGKCSCGDEACTSPGKHPACAHGVKEGTTDPDRITAWWQALPDCNIAVCTGELSGVWVLDIDPRHHGDVALSDLEQEHGKLFSSVECLTGGGGRHLYFKYPKSGIVRTRTNHPSPGLDVRGEGGYVVAPPSSHVSGTPYEWEVSSVPFDHPVEEAPQWLQSMVVEIPAAGSPGSAAQQTPQSQQQQAQPKTVTAGGRNAYITRQAGKLRRAGFTTDEMETALLKLNQTRCIPPLPVGEIKKIAASVGRYSAPHLPTDDELADAWLQKYSDTAYGLGDFRRYTGGFWPVVPMPQIEAELLQIMEAAKRDGYKPTSWKLRSIMELARIKTTVDNDRWNADRDMLVCQNGTLHIPTMTLLPHDKELYLTSGAAYAYDQSATAPTWDYFCQTILNSSGGFLQEFAGYALTIDTSLETAIWLYGPPGSGKSTFIEGLIATLGSKAGILGLADLEKSRFSLTDLPDKTLLVSTEQPSMFMQATEKVNALISGEPVLIDRKFRDPIVIQSNAKICWAMNELPRVSEANNGLFRRVRVVEFADLPEGARSPEVKKLIATEGAGILNWALAGLQRLRLNGGFTLPQCVIEATDLFKATNDVPKVFVDDWCELGPSYSIQSSVLYQSYRQWCSDNGHKPQSSTSLALDWRRLGFTSQRTMTGVFWRGLRLKSSVP